MKREGIEYDERMELLEEITWPKPLDELLAQAYEVFASSQPWIRGLRAVAQVRRPRHVRAGVLVRGVRLALTSSRAARDSCCGT